MNQEQEYRKKLMIAKRIIITTKSTSISYLQRKMQISYNQTAILMCKISKLSGFKFLYKDIKKNSYCIKFKNKITR